MVVLLVFKFHEKLLAPRLADALHALLMAARKETKDLMWKTEHLDFYLVFLDRLERLGEAVQDSGSGRTRPSRWTSTRRQSGSKQAVRKDPTQLNHSLIP